MKLVLLLGLAALAFGYKLPHVEDDDELGKVTARVQRFMRLARLRGQ
jgi:hypothetical protein